VSDTEYDVVIAAYLIPDLAHEDFDNLVKRVADQELEVEGVALVTVDADGEVAVEETGDHLGRRGVKLGGGVGVVVGLFAPPLLAATAVGAAAGALVGKFAQHKVSSGLGDKLGDALPPGSAGILAIYDRAKTELVTATLVSAVRSSTAEIDGGGVKDLKAALAEAQAGMGGG
jgi:arylsulfatase